MLPARGGTPGDDYSEKSVKTCGELYLKLNGKRMKLNN
nr:MAG TPA: hypothetical protein [Caudoviricetes sp.]